MGAWELESTVPRYMPRRRLCYPLTLPSSFSHEPILSTERATIVPSVIMRPRLDETVVFRLPESGLSVFANRYSPTQGSPGDTGITLVFAHCSSSRGLRYYYSHGYGI